MVYVFYFLLAYFIILILYTTDFNSKINKDIIIIIIIIIITIIIIIIIDVKMSRCVFARSDYFISFNEIDIKITLKKWQIARQENGLLFVWFYTRYLS